MWLFMYFYNALLTVFSHTAILKVLFLFAPQRVRFIAVAVLLVVNPQNNDGLLRLAATYCPILYLYLITSHFG